MTSRRKVFTAALPSAAIALASARTGAAQLGPRNTNSATTALSFPVGTGSFIGKLTVTAFQAANGVLTAVGALTGSVTSSGSTTPVSIDPISVPVLAVSGSCTILTLTLGPLDLNILGLMIHLNQVVLTITAVTGAGQLLGNLLCAIANLLNTGTLGTLLSELTSLLNQILAAL